MDLVLEDITGGENVCALHSHETLSTLILNVFFHYSNNNDFFFTTSIKNCTLVYGLKRFLFLAVVMFVVLFYIVGSSCHSEGIFLFVFI